ncbi:hypothetical protein [Afipia carboxidovorans]|uniref:hypothetical protein n=1 Tax=Afipia carboxidovorans TaxID=40137 RepID=UPI0030CD2F93
MKATSKAMTGLPKEKEADEPMPFSSAAREPAMLSRDQGESFLNEGRDRRLRNQLILANIVAWIVIALAVRYFFF